jgi:hypothetical protein
VCGKPTGAPFEVVDQSDENIMTGCIYATLKGHDKSYMNILY